jgi:ATP-dependent DNA ligase
VTAPVRVRGRGLPKYRPPRKRLHGRTQIGPDLFRAACKFGLEGIVSKRHDRPYRAGRSPDWIKVKDLTGLIGSGPQNLDAVQLRRFAPSGSSANAIDVEMESRAT